MHIGSGNASTFVAHLDDHVYIGTKNEAGDTHYVLDYDVMAESFVDTLDLGAGFAWSTYLNAFDNGTKTLVYHLGGVQKINLEDTDPSPEFLVATDTYSVYGLQVIDNNSKLIVCDAKDYVVDGDVHLYDMAGNLEKTLTTGPLPKGPWGAKARGGCLCETLVFTPVKSFQRLSGRMGSFCTNQG